MTDTTVSAGDRAPQELKSPTKTRVDENFPVASRLIPERVRRHVHVFYLCARAADDVADDPDRAPAEKTALLTEMDEALAGERGRTPTTETCHDLIEILDGTGVTIDHARHLLQAFRMDVTKLRYRNWSELINYCQYSAAPVGRFLLDIHGEDGSARPMTDALCDALQILNHLQDCKNDYLGLDRVYIPQPWLREQGIDVEALAADAASPALRAVLDRVLDRTDELIVTARAAPAFIRDRGLRLETAVITAIAGRLSAKLRRLDPVAVRVELNKLEYLLCVIAGVARGFLARR
jgi:squalene synthase HpnC